MPGHRVSVFRPYPFAPKHKIHIEGGPRGGDWEVVAADAKTLHLRCPVSGREVTWKPFCYLVEERDDAEWPARE